MAGRWDVEEDRPHREREHRGGELGPLDGLYLQMNTTAIIVLSILFNVFAFIMGITCILTAKHPGAKENATRSVIVVIAVGVVGAIGSLIYGGFFSPPWFF